ncbi:MAG: BatA domain-containing protein [Acidobacteria bacterium]|nr:BatA domain-containing protein [Acidobacteriota bacterium]
MTFLYPTAFFAVFLVTVPVLIHLLVHRRAERLVFPTLRFIQPARLASMRRRMLDDVPLLAVRVAILGAAIAALAAPLLITSARERAWNARVVRETVAGADLRDGLRRAVAALGHAPPARREIVVASAFPIGSLTPADIAAVPTSIGLRFERIGALPETRSTADTRVLADGGAVLSRQLTLAGARTSVREARAAEREPFPIEVDAPPGAKPALDAAIAAVLSQRVWAPPAGRRARLVIAGRPTPPVTPANAPWMADAIARMSRDSDLRTAASHTTGISLDARFVAPPWQVVAVSDDVGAELAPPAPLIVVAASGSDLLVVSAASPLDIVTPVLLRSIVNSLAVLPDLRQAEVVTISDSQLRAWSRPAPPPAAPRLDSPSLEDVSDDRPWFWAATLALLALEGWMRRARATDVNGGAGDVARVA